MMAIPLQSAIVTLVLLTLVQPATPLASAVGAERKAAVRAIFKSPADPVLACPVDKTPLRTELSAIAGVRRESKLSAAGRVYPVNALYSDLLPSASQTSTLDLVAEISDLWNSRVQTGLFRSPVTAFLYERGWRQNFANAGFPGIDVEFAEVSEFFEAAKDGVVVDMSCGSGLMTRRLVKSAAYRRVLALDYSEAMLRETRRRLGEESVSTDALTLCRADVAALPLQPGAVDAMHAGAAMHCWPKLEEGLTQIYAALKPDGGRFFATTFLQGAYGGPMPRQTGGGSFRFFDIEAELEQLLVDAGFSREDVDVRREGRGCAIIRAVRR